VIGYDVSHPPPMSFTERQMVRSLKMRIDSLDDEDSDVDLDMTSLHPSVVGICANMASNPHSFVGDYFFQKCRKESLDSTQLSKRVKWILEGIEEHRPSGKCPPYVFIFRDGLSEGQFDMAYQDELEAIRKGFQLYNSSYSPKIIFVVGTKRHFKRIFIENANIESRNTRDSLFNLMPGSVISDTKVVRADVPQVFLQAHFPLRGSSKPTEYSILADEIGVTQDELQGLLMSLCYSHQIVNSAISIPEPVYQADEIAKRGRNNFMCLRKYYPEDVPYKEKYKIGKFKLIDHRRLNDTLSYWEGGKTFMTNRFTA